MKKLKYLALTLALVSSLALNVATVAFSTIAMALSAVFEAVTGASAVASELRRKNAVNEKKIKDLNADLDLKEKRAAKLSGELAKDRKRIASLTDDLAGRDRRIASLSATIKNPNVTYRKEIKPLGHAVEDTVGRISKRTTLGAKRNVAAIFGESIPLLGVGVAVAVTGYELKDSCDNLKDLRELEVSINPSLAYAADVKEVCGMQVPTKDEIWTSASTSPAVAWETAKSYAPDLEDWQFPQGSFAGAWETAKTGGGSVWGVTKDAAETMKLGWDYNMQMLKDAFDQSADPE